MERKVTKINISRNWAKRPTDNSIIEGHVWGVAKGEPYDLVQFGIEDIEGYYWNKCLCFPVGMPEDEIKQEVEEYAKNNISDEEIAHYKWFLECGEKWGWD